MFGRTDRAEKSKGRRRGSARRLAILALCLGLTGFGAAAGWAGWLHLSGNFHTVREGVLYRSAQPMPAELQRQTAQHGIRSVLNLRGAKPGVQWYDAELAEAQSLGLVHADFEMSASRKPSPEEVTQLISLMRGLPQPVLIHCLAGSDRTGLASALYLAGVLGTDEEVAEGQISFAYGHVSIPMLSKAWAMDESWEEAEAMMGFKES